MEIEMVQVQEEESYWGGRGRSNGQKQLKVYHSLSNLVRDYWKI